MYSLNLISCLILLGLGSIYVLTKPLSVGNKIPSVDSNGIARHGEIYLDEIALALVQNIEDSESSSDEEGLIFTEPYIPADDSNNVSAPAGVPVTGNSGSNGSIIGSETKVNGPTSGTGNNNSKSGVVTSPDGNQTNIGQTTVQNDGTIVDNQGNTVAKVNPNGSVVDNNGNVVGKIDNDNNVVDNNGNTVATVGDNGSVTPITPIAVPVVGNNGGNGGGVPTNNNNNGGNNGGAPTNNNNNGGNNGGAPTNNNSGSKSGIVTAPDGSTTNIADSTVDPNGNIVDPSGNVVGKINDNGSVVDSKGNPVGSIDNNGNVVDNNGNTVANVDGNTGKITSTPVSSNLNNPQDAANRGIKNRRGGELLYVLLPCFALLCGTGALAKKMLTNGDNAGNPKSENEPLTEMNNVAPVEEEPIEYAPVEYANTKTNGYGPVAGAGAGPSGTTTTKTTKTTTTTYHSGAPKNMNAYQTNNIGSTDLPAVETGPSMNSLIRDEFVNNKTSNVSNVMLPAVLGGAAAASSSKTTKSYNTAPSVNTKKTTTTTTTTTTTKSSTSPKSTKTYKSAPLTPSDLETNDSTYNNKYATSTSSKSKYLFGAAPLAAGAYSSSKQSSKTKNTTSYNNVPVLGGNEEEEIIEEYIVEHGPKSPKFTTKNTVNVAAAAPQEIVEEEYIVEEGSRKPKKTIKKTTKTTTTYRTIYKNGVPVQVPVSEEETSDMKNIATGAAAAGAAGAAAAASSSSKDAKAENPYMSMIPSVIETIVKHSIPMGDRAEEEKNNDLKKLMTMANVSLPEILGGGSSSSENRNTTTTTTTTTTTETRESSKNPKKTVKKTVYKTIYKNGLPVQVPVEEEEEEVVKVMKSPKLKGINKRVTTYNINDKDAQDAPVIEEFSLSPKEASTEELPAEFKEYTEEFEVPSHKATKQKTIKKYVTVYKTVYKNGKPVEVVENIEIPEGKTPEEVIAALPKESMAEKRTVKQTVIEKPVKESVIEERIVKPSVVKAPKVQSVKKYVTTYKTTYKNGVPVEETTETEDLPGPITETNNTRAENTTIEDAKSPKMKKIKKVTTYKTIYKNGKPVEVIEEVPEETIITAAPALITTKNVTVPEEDTEITLGDKKTKKIINKVKKPSEETEEIYEEYIIEEGADPKNLKRTVYRNGVPVTEDTDITIPIDGEQTEEMYEEYVIEDGKEKSVKKTFYRNGVEVPESEVSIRDVNARSSASSPYMKLAPTIIENIVKYAIPGNKNDGEADFANLMGKVTEIATTVIPSTETKEVVSTEPQTTGNISTKEIITTKKGPVTTKQGPGSRYSSKTRTKIVDGKEVEETEEVYEEYIIEDGKEKTVKRTVYINGVEVPNGENKTRDLSASSPYMKLAPSVISYIVKYAIPGANNDSKTDLADLMGQMTSITGLLGDKKEGEEEPNFPLRIPLEDKGIRSSESEVDNIVESREGLPSIIEEDENLPMENNRSTETTYETKKFEKHTLPKRSSSKRLSLELKAAVAMEIAKLENEINEETKNIPRPRKQSITNNKALIRKESEQSIKAMAEGCLVRKPSNASSSAKSSSVIEEWSGPIFDKKVFEVVIEHIPQLPDEVKLNIGDLVEVKQVFEDGWAYGINTATKIDGTFPVNCLGEEREPNKNGRYVPRLIRVFQARDEAGKKDIEDEEKFKNELSEYAKKKKELKMKKQQKKRK